MTRVLHLHGRPPDFQTERGAAAVRGHLGAGFDVATRTIRPGGDYRHVASAVLRLRGSGGERFDVVHAWDERALTAAALAGAGPIVFSPSPFLSARSVRWVRAVMGYRDVQVIAPTSTLRRYCVERGVPPARCHLVRPGVDFARVRRRRDAALRGALGLDESHHVILVPGESTEPAAHAQAVWAGSVLGVLDERYKVLLWGRGRRGETDGQLGAKLGQPGLVRVAQARLGRRVEFEELLTVADSVMVPATGPVATLPIATAMAAALPIVAAVTYTVAELLEDRHTALMVPPGRPRLLARRVLEHQEDGTLQWQIADMARTEAFEYFAQTRFVDQYRTVYRQVAAGERVEVPEPSPGAGRRFHGRG